MEGLHCTTDMIAKLVFTMFHIIRPGYCSEAVKVIRLIFLIWNLSRCEHLSVFDAISGQRKWCLSVVLDVQKLRWKWMRFFVCAWKSLSMFIDLTAHVVMCVRRLLRSSIEWDFNSFYLATFDAQCCTIVAELLLLAHSFLLRLKGSELVVIKLKLHVKLTVKSRRLKLKRDELSIPL